MFEHYMFDISCQNDKRRTRARTLHSHSKFRVSATETFQKTTFTEVPSSKILPETSGF
jgi:hypothetical protein